MVALARALIAMPKVLLLDEPTSAMDAQTENRFLDQLQHALHDQTVVIVTHRPSALRLVDRVIVIDEGKLVADGNKTDIMARLASRRHGPTPSVPEQGEQRA